MDSQAEENLELLRLFRRCAHVQRCCRNSFPGQAYLLILLRRYGPMTQRKLTDLTQRRPATLSEQLDRMERAGLVERRTSPGDRRNLDLTLTPAGEQAACQAEKERAEAACRLFGPLSGGEKDRLRRMLEHLLEIWEQAGDAREGNGT